ncbi:8615_t:CDS:2, partial [Paraglomus occultum]
KKAYINKILPSSLCPSLLSRAKTHSNIPFSRQQRSAELVKIRRPLLAVKEGVSLPYLVFRGRRKETPGRKLFNLVLRGRGKEEKEEAFSHCTSRSQNGNFPTFIGHYLPHGEEVDEACLRSRKEEENWRELEGRRGRGVKKRKIGASRDSNLLQAGRLNSHVCQEKYPGAGWFCY